MHCIPVPRLRPAASVHPLWAAPFPRRYPDMCRSCDGDRSRCTACQGGYVLEGGKCLKVWQGEGQLGQGPGLSWGLAVYHQCTDTAEAASRPAVAEPGPPSQRSQALARAPPAVLAKGVRRVHWLGRPGALPGLRGGPGPGQGLRQVRPLPAAGLLRLRARRGLLRQLQQLARRLQKLYNGAVHTLRRPAVR